MKISKEAKKLIENNPVFIGSASLDGKPNITIVDGCKVKDEKIYINDVQMTTCKEYLKSNPHCCLISYSDKEGFGYKLFGNAEYLEKRKKLHGGFNAKGLIIVKVENLFKVL